MHIPFTSNNYFTGTECFLFFTPSVISGGVVYKSVVLENSFQEKQAEHLQKSIEGDLLTKIVLNVYLNVRWPHHVNDFNNIPSFTHQSQNIELLQFQIKQRAYSCTPFR